MNNVNLVGRLVKDPETRDAGNRQITELRLATERPRIRDGKVVKNNQGFTEKDTEFHRITVFGQLGVSVAQHKQKGDLIAVRGWLHYSSWTDADDTRRHGVEIVAEEITFL
jgi:single-strand DNA-binding protein